MSVQRVTVNDVQRMADRGEPIPVLTAYDAPTARALDDAGIPMILVGDSLGNTVLGFESTIPVTLEMMIHHTAAVVRGTQRALVIGDLPFLSYQVSPEQALESAGRLMQEAGCQAVKLEGGRRSREAIEKIVEAGIPVAGHIGMTPQSVNAIGGHRVQGKSVESAIGVTRDALAVQNAGAFCVFLELVAIELSQTITERLRIPTIGIGAGPATDGQVLVLADLLGWNPDFQPRHSTRYADLHATALDAARRFAEDVRSRSFPTDDNGTHLRPETIDELHAREQLIRRIEVDV
ncbi:MAG: 3-methyl-2-oxobutanoate hydroxymethyltransferase [Candidatus Limnocylindria bacterium]